MKHIFYPEVEGFDALSIGLSGASKMMVKLLSEDMVCIEIEPGGHTPDHAHDDKERIVVMSGKGLIKLDNDRIDIKPGDFIEFDPHQQHQVLNNGDEDFVFICLRNQ